MFTKSQIDAVIAGIKSNRAKGWKESKAVQHSFYKVFNTKVSSSLWSNAISNNDIIPYLESLSIAYTASDIDALYTSINSCMSGEPVGEFYSRIGVPCIGTTSGRSLINPITKEYYCVYGSKHYMLEAILNLMGFTITAKWLNSLEAEVIDVVNSETCHLPFIDGKLNKYGQTCFTDTAICESESVSPSDDLSQNDFDDFAAMLVADFS